ncbi:MAG TPA: hypothetical protein VG992_04885, partial [Candidatus Saccharimonadales bacterium]|nr:hypothetical protein [Candidatus Saccharimonadales bacterium]
LSWVPEMVKGRTIEEVGDKYEGDLLEEGAMDLHVRWEQAVHKADLAVNDADPEAMAHVSYGDISVDDYLRQVGGDLLIHAWDLGQAIAIPVRFAPDVAQVVYERTLPRKKELAASGLFAPAIKVPESADLQTKLLALFGRHVDWRAM